MVSNYGKLIALQKKLSSQIKLKPINADSIKYIADADISLNKFSDIAYAGFVVLKFPTLEVVETSLYKGKVRRL